LIRSGGFYAGVDMSADGPARVRGRGGDSLGKRKPAARDAPPIVDPTEAVEHPNLAAQSLHQENVLELGATGLEFVSR
jgi:hypothetical protein